MSGGLVVIYGLQVDEAVNKKLAMCQRSGDSRLDTRMIVETLNEAYNLKMDSRELELVLEPNGHLLYLGYPLLQMNNPGEDDYPLNRMEIRPNDLKIWNQLTKNSFEKDNLTLYCRRIGLDERKINLMFVLRK